MLDGMRRRIAAWRGHGASRAYLAPIGDASALGRWLQEHYGDSVAGVSVTNESAMRLVYVYACVHVLAQTLAQMPIALMRRDGKSSMPAVGHPIYGLVSRRPSSAMTSYVWRSTAESHRQMTGNSFTEILRSGPYAESLLLHRPERVHCDLAPDGTVRYRVSPETGEGSRVVMASDMIHVAGLGYDGRVGYSPIAVARDAIGLGLAIQEAGGRFFRQGSMPKGIIESDLSANAMKKVVDAFVSNFTGVMNSGKTPVLPKGMRYKATTINPDDAQTLQTAQFTRTQICGLFRVPPQFVMDLERSTFTNAVEMDLHFVKHTILPHCVAWEQELDRKLLSEADIAAGYHFQHDVDSMLRGATKQRYEAYHMALQDGWMTRNEVRASERLPALDGLDAPLVPTNMQTGDAESVDADEMNDNDPPPQA